MPLLINQFGTERRMCLALGVERLDDVAARIADVMELTPPQGLLDKVRALGKLSRWPTRAPRSCAAAPARRS